MDHLVLHCIKMQLLWELLFSLFGVTWVNLLSIIYTLLSWRGFLVGKKRKKGWLASPYCLFRRLGRGHYKDEVFSI